MWVNLLLYLFVAHLVADFVLQSNKTCIHKREKKWGSWHHYLHAFFVFALSWVVSFDVQFWWCALIIGVSHLLIDVLKSYREDKVEWFVIDQLLHILVLVGISLLWCKSNDWMMSFCVETKIVAIIAAVLVCWKPSNIFIKRMLKHYSLEMTEENNEYEFKAGALIGNLERWLILVFVLMQHYEALGLLIAAKSIIRFGDKDKIKTTTEYVLAGTLMSIFIAVVAGLIVLLFK